MNGLHKNNLQKQIEESNDQFYSYILVTFFWQPEKGDIIGKKQIKKKHQDEIESQIH